MAPSTSPQPTISPPPATLPTPTEEMPIPLWRKNDNIISEYEADPASLQQVLHFLVNKIDTLTAKYEELDSRNNIMQSSLFTALSNSLDSKFANVRNNIAVKLREYNSEHIIDQCAEVCQTMMTAVDGKIDELSKQNKETRKGPFVGP